MIKDKIKTAAKASNRSFSQLRSIALAAFGLFSLVLINACGSASAPTGNPSAANGVAMITLTDAPGDFLSYMVTVNSLQLTRQDGKVVQTVTNSTPVDFAQLVNLSEIISAAQVPAGKYISAALTLDYSAANIVVDNGNGGLTVQPTSILDSSGNAVTGPVTLTLNFPSGRPFVISERAVSNLALDFNLLAANTVLPNPITDTTAAGDVTVQVSPSISASLVPDAVKQIRVRGPLVSFDAAAQTYTINVRPFYNSEGLHGQLTVMTTADTTFNIDGVAYNSADGWTALQNVSPDTLTSAYGSFNVAEGTFTASSVFIGSSVNGSTLDSVEGTVVARSGDTITIENAVKCYRGHSDRSGRKAGHSRSITVTLGASTMVTRDGQAGTFGSQDISVGQHVQVFGTFAEDDSRTLDATNGSVRLMLTTLVGTVTAYGDNMLTVELKTLDGVRPSQLDFAGTGTPSNADASAYTISIPAGVDVSNITGTVRLYGYVSSFGSDAANFEAVTIVSSPNAKAQVLIGFSNDGDIAPFTPAITADSTNMIISQASLQAAGFAKIRVNGDYLDVSTLTDGLSIEVNSDAAHPQFVIAHRNGLTFDSYESFGEMVAALTTDLNGTTGLLGLYASGPYNSITGVLSADVLLIALSD